MALLYLFIQSNKRGKVSNKTVQPVKRTKAEVNPGDLLKEATAQKKKENYDRAAELLRRAYNEIAKTNIQYDVKTFLRLPLYLQKSGRNDEAWREFNLLITHGFPNQPPGEAAYEDIKSKIYDKMRLFLQREGRKSFAINFGVLSYLADLKGRYLTGQKKELYMQYFDQYSTEDTVERIVEKLVKKADREDIKEELCSLVQKSIEKMPDIFEEEIEDSINLLLNKKNA